MTAATASSGLPVTYSNASGACTIDGNGLLKITGAGYCTATASQPGNGSYGAASPVPSRVAITRSAWAA